MRLMFLMACAAVCFAQADDNIITVNTTRQIVLQPDQATVQVQLTSPAEVGLDEALAVLEGAGIAAGDLTAVNSTGSTLGPRLSWVFAKTVPLAQLNAALTALAAADQNLAKQKPGYDLSYAVYSQTSSPDAQKAAGLCPVPALLSAARAQAQRMADAAGVRVGAILSMSQGANTGVVTVPTYAFRSGDFSAIFDPATGTGGVAYTLIGVLSPVPVTAPGMTCALTVQFQLLR